MDKTIEKEFSIGDLLNLLISRSDDNILEMKFTSIVPTKHILVMSFYNDEKNQISQKNFKFLCNYKNILFDNILLISNLKSDSFQEIKNNKINQKYKLKILNKNIAYMKFYIQTLNILNQSEYSFSQVFNLKQMKILTKEEIKNLSLNNDTFNPMSESSNNKKEKNNINMILAELDNINKNLAEKQKDLEAREKEITKKENYINKQKKIIEQKIIQFKEEILLFGDKCYGECVNEINNKMQKLNKKLAKVENNITNKYRILKDKIYINKNIPPNNNSISQEKKDKIANLEIKIKILEDSLSKLKEKNVENEEKIKNFISNEEKLNTTIKKLKDELILANSQIKEKEKKNKINNNMLNSNMSISNISNIDNKDNVSISSMLTKVKNKKKSNMISFEIDKHQKEIIFKYFVYNFVLEYRLKANNSNEKDILTASILLMHLSTNPIELYNKFELGHIIILHKLIYNIYLNNTNYYQVLIKEGLNDLYNKLPEFKNNISLFVSNNKRNYFEFNPLIELNIILETSSIIDKNNSNTLINEVNFSNIIFNKCISFNNFISKSNVFSISKLSSNNNNINNERKNKIKKYTIISNLVLSIIFCSTIQELLSILKQVMNYFTNSKKDKEIINFLIKIKFGKILLLIFQKIANSEVYSEKINNNDNEIKELIQYIIDSILLIMAYMNNNRISDRNNKEQNGIINDLDINIEKDIGFILLENKFIAYIKNNLNDYLKYYNEIKNNPLNKFVSIDQKYYDTNNNNFIKCIVLITNLCIYCANLRMKIKDSFMENIMNIQNSFKNIDKKDNDKKEDKYISFISKNISTLLKLIA